MLPPDILYNSAQIVLLKLGFDSAQLLSHLKGKNASHRKKGPGRKHQQGRKNAEQTRNTSTQP